MFEQCLDCKWYDDVLEGDTLLHPFGDVYVCQLCAEARGIDIVDILGSNHS